MQWRCLSLPWVLRSGPIFYSAPLRLEIGCIPTYLLRNQSTSASPAVVSEDIAPEPHTLDDPKRDSTPLRFTKHNTLSEKNTFTNTQVKISGLVRSIRKQKRYAFAHVSDGSTLSPIQAILTPDQAKDVTNGSYVELEGQWKASPGKGQSHELQVARVNKLGESNPDESPLQKKSQSAEFLRSIPHLRLRTPLYSLLARARNQAIAGVHHFYDAQANQGSSATFVQPPLITSSDCEGAGEVFTISPRNSQGKTTGSSGTSGEVSQNYFREPKYLTVSSQLHLEAYSAELGDVWTLSPTFRAEESDTPRHLSEFYMLEAEFRGVTSLSEVQERAKNLIQAITIGITNSRVGDELLSYYQDPKYQDEEKTSVDIEARWDALRNGEWRTITYDEAMAALQASNHSLSGKPLFAHKPEWEQGLALEHERWIVENLGKNKPVFVTHYPKQIKPFYMLASSEDTTAPRLQRDSGDTVACFDLLLPYGTCEAVGGSLREHRLEQLLANMRDKSLLATTSSSIGRDVDQQHSSSYPFLQPDESLGRLQWYADLRRFGSSPHGGFGLGFDRLLAYLTGIANVRDIVAFPRTWGRADC